MVTARFCPDISTIPASLWRALFSSGPDNASPYPFARYEFLLALEQSGSVSAQQGWQPQHLLLEQQGAPIAVAPCYLKSHSYGEYVFDWAWADAYAEHGLDYYPKLLIAIPFTPVTGPRLGIAEGQDPTQMIPLLTQALQQRCDQLGGSGYQLLFAQPELHQQLEQLGWLHRDEIQYHWFNRGYGDFDAFLATLAARKRKNILKERQSLESVTIRRLPGEAITPRLWAAFFAGYQRTYLKRSGHEGYLNATFFHQIGQSMPEQLMLVVAERGDEILASALFFYDQSCLYGRYWSELTHLPNLHFELCYYQGIQFCIERGLARFDPGAQGEHKISRGFEPVRVHGSCDLRHAAFRAAIADYCQRERILQAERLAALRQRLPFRHP
ncbi:GNAT family N-acetyltransferase [Ferrimonas gelatinilytica]|uniref:GNAT family N-acetyltransferase n=2 Tax=Ferrimonas gelatinilytica TaxID=1255257 RepID=A0ABP9RZ36_9GAMM